MEEPNLKLIKPFPSAETKSSSRIESRALIDVSSTDRPVATRRTQIGVRGYLRLSRVMIEFFLFMFRVFLNAHGWYIGKRASQSELRFREGAALREKLLRLGPTFIKTGQTIATRADLLPVEY